MTATADRQTLSVLRNTRQRWFTGAVIVLMIVLIAQGVFINSVDGAMSDQLGYYVIMAFPTWLIWRAVYCSKVEVSTWGLVIVNWFRIYSVPWAAVRSIDAGDELSIVLNDGRVIRPAVGEASLVGAAHGSPAQRALRDRISALRASAQDDAGATATDRIDVYARYALPVLVIGAILVVLLTLIRV